MKLIITREIPLKVIIHCPLLFYRDDFGNLNKITGEIFTPIIVRKSKTNKGKFELIAGERRCKKAEKDGKKTIKCAVYEMTDAQAIWVHAKENLQRKDLNPIEEGKQYKKMLETLKISQEQLAKELKKGGVKRSQEHISNRIRLLELSEPVQKHLALNRFGVYAGLLLLGIKDEDLQIEMAERCVNGKWTVSKLDPKIKELKARLEGYVYPGQYVFVDNPEKDELECVFIPPQNIQPYKKTRPIKIIRADHDCKEVSEKLLKIFKVYIWKAGSNKCSDCPLEKVCITVANHEILFDPSYRNQRSLSFEEFRKISEKEKKGVASSEVDKVKEGKPQAIKLEEAKSESSP